MKKSLLATSLALTLTVTSFSSLADDPFVEDNNPAQINTVKKGITFGTASVIGGLLAGPVGVMLGGISGTVLADELNQADSYEAAVKENKMTKAQLAGTQADLAALQEQLHIARQEQQQLQQLAMTSLEFQLLFHTGTDELNHLDLQRLDELANFLHRNPELSIRLHGHADPRGSDEYNNMLSMHRAANVQHALEARGIQSQRIERRSYGANQSRAAKGNLDAYALERRVSIEIFNTNKGVAAIK